MTPKPQGFSRAERLHREAEFDRVFRHGRRVWGKLISVCFAPNGLGRSRLGIALGRGWRSAVARNRAKRLVREAFRTRKAELPKGLDLVVIPRGGWVEPSVAAIGDELVRLLTRTAAEAGR